MCPVTSSGFHKKLTRDEVRYSSGALPWRREPVWAALKGSLHLALRAGRRQTAGEIEYKEIITMFLAFVLKRTATAGVSQANVSESSLLESARKLVRRQDKLEKLWAQYAEHANALRAEATR